MVGIYKITSPSNKVYVGQSWDIQKRWRTYRKNRNSKQRILNFSFEKYGYDAHKFEVIHELPQDVTQEALDNYEQLYMDAYRDCGIELLNCREGGSKGKLSEETKKIIGQKSKGRKHSEETKKKISDYSKAQKMPEHLKNKLKSIWTGKKHSEETKKKLSELKRGTKLSEEHKQKIRGYRHTDEARQK